MKLKNFASAIPDQQKFMDLLITNTSYNNASVTKSRCKDCGASVICTDTVNYGDNKIAAIILIPIYSASLRGYPSHQMPSTYGGFIHQNT